MSVDVLRALLGSGQSKFLPSHSHSFCFGQAAIKLTFVLQILYCRCGPSQSLPPCAGLKRLKRQTNIKVIDHYKCVIPNDEINKKPMQIWPPPPHSLTVGWCRYVFGTVLRRHRNACSRRTKTIDSILRESLLGASLLDEWLAVPSPFRPECRSEQFLSPSPGFLLWAAGRSNPCPGALLLRVRNGNDNRSEVEGESTLEGIVTKCKKNSEVFFDSEKNIDRHFLQK